MAKSSRQFVDEYWRTAAGRVDRNENDTMNTRCPLRKLKAMFEEERSSMGPVVSSTSISLLDRLKERDSEGWRRFVRLYGPLIFQWCRRRNLNDDDAADVVQEVFRTVFLRMADFRRTRPGDSFRGWLWTITRFKLGDHLRRSSRQPVVEGGANSFESLNDLPEILPNDEDDASDHAELVRRALSLIRVEFEERTWQAFWRSTIDGHAPKDIADEMNMTAHAVRMAKSRVLRRLREELHDALDEPEADVPG
jgi:RNA polymerase sigma-70 factor, ECF subfamily